MQEFLNPALQPLNDCGCCEGTMAQTPIEIFNRPGLAAIAYRVGTYAQFKQSLLARLAASELLATLKGLTTQADNEFATPLLNTWATVATALRQLTTRSDSDFAIALLDAWSVVADVLTFYQEQFANEHYLLTATERESLLYLSQLIGYKPRSGVAASTILAFTVDDAPGAPATAIVDVGVKVQSVPEAGKLPQTFETIERIEAKAAWNALRPRQKQMPTLSTGMVSVTVQGIATNLKVGDKVLIVESEGDRGVRSLTALKTDTTTQTTRLQFSPGSQTPPARFSVTLPPGEAPAPETALSQAVVAQLILGKSWNQKDLIALAKTQGWSLSALSDYITELITNPEPAGGGVFAFRVSAALFGHNAAKQVTYTNVVINTTPFGQFVLNQLLTPRPNPPSQWQDWTPADDEAANRLYLDNAYEGILPDSFMALRESVNSQTFDVYDVNAVITRTRTAYGISGKTTRLSLSQSVWTPTTDTTLDFLRSTTVYAQSEPLTIVAEPITTAVQGSVILLDGVVLDLEVGQMAVLTGDRLDLPGISHSELIILATVTLESGYTQITLKQALQYAYDRASVSICANVVPATHGETVQEVLGSGNASVAFPAFTLRQPPLTYISSDTTASGAASTLQVRVNDVLWHESPMLFGKGPSDRVYVTQLSDDGKITVTFGDSQTGARLATGQENVRAKYRKGIGTAGNVEAAKLTTLVSRPLGIKGVTNPQPATGGDDPESLERVRENAPLTVRTLDRVVSLQDYEDFARAFMGIAKALATWSWTGQVRCVFLTVAGPNGATIAPTSSTYQNLISQLRQSGDPYVPLEVKSYVPALFRLAANVKIDPDYERDRVLAAVKAALQQGFSFQSRNFGQGVALSEIVAVMQAVPGVVAIDVDKLHRTDGIGGSGLKAPLPAKAPQSGVTGATAAELLTLDPVSLEQLGVMP
jgi:predicted phage baseplate assembly protein